MGSDKTFKIIASLIIYAEMFLCYFSQLKTTKILKINKKVLPSKMWYVTIVFIEKNYK